VGVLAGFGFQRASKISKAVAFAFCSPWCDKNPQAPMAETISCGKVYKFRMELTELEAAGAGAHGIRGSVHLQGVGQHCRLNQE